MNRKPRPLPPMAFKRKVAFIPELHTRVQEISNKYNKPFSYILNKFMYDFFKAKDLIEPSKEAMFKEFFDSNSLED